MIYGGCGVRDVDVEGTICGGWGWFGNKKNLGGEPPLRERNEVKLDARFKEELETVINHSSFQFH